MVNLAVQSLFYTYPSTAELMRQLPEIQQSVGRFGVV